MGFSQALSGLNAASANLDVVGNNIANSQTVGFKSSSVQFADVYAGAKVGLGTRVSAVLQDFSNGTLESTNRNLDLAISGGGFFRMTQNDQVVYSRNGQLTMTSDGYLENAQGARLTGFPAGVGAGGQPQELKIPSEGLAANPTTAIDTSLNLNAEDATIDRATVTFDAADPTTYSYANSATVYDSLGVAHNVTMYFTKTADNQWEVRQRMDGSAPVPDNVGSLSFNANGTLDTAGSTFPTYGFTPGGGADPLTYDIDFAGTTQFGGDFELSSLNQNGYTSGSLVGIAINDDGNIVGNFSNEQSQVLGTISLANFRNPEGLQPVGDNAWAETGKSGQALLGQAGTGMFGSVESGVVETSNVDLTSELVDLIIAQRNFQANTNSVRTQSEVLESVVNLR
ncbi:flagellar hook protein FlgE [Modicisalibacter ilicicola DSM 19980]|uniref:Flagellar hook protein FlgE n=1 Tax=Modicisalibacter ilicicola DSM 19980 TaxID=1121942 RepID=A0A1M4Z0E7_9GAMM|nr:flagellar hook protein FlgE [Halomonas ilicicola]SHF11524.1 flagellar hook protein FlgE [Halomonas ilicicola DSM 19980]